MSRSEDRHRFPGVAGLRVAFYRARDAETSTTLSDPLDHLCKTLSGFTFLTDRLRAAAEPALAPHLTVTGWQDGILRVRLDEPALATRWRFAAPALGRALARMAAFEGLREIRLSLGRVELGAASRRRPGPDTLVHAPVDALDALAESARVPALQQALQRLAEAARRARERRSQHG